MLYVGVVVAVCRCWLMCDVVVGLSLCCGCLMRLVAWRVVCWTVLLLGAVVCCWCCVLALWLLVVVVVAR